jgi:acyl-CoA synthetase (NDP forming)
LLRKLLRTSAAPPELGETVTEAVSTDSASLHPLDQIFHPRSIAIVGVPSGGGKGMGGGFLGSLLELKFQENHDLYPVNPKIDEIDGLRCYPSILDIEGHVDHVISMIPARFVPTLVDQCIEKGVRSIHFFTAGFSETGDEEMAKTEREFIQKLNDAGIRAIGPNCMGLYIPDERVAFMNGFPAESGEVFLLSQSGANAGDIVHGLSKRGVRFSKAVSFGNGADVKAHHLLDYAASDPQTKVVVGYMEGVQEGRKFFEALKRCAAVKPTIILKGGIHAAGARAANSHTGSLAGSIRIFEAACRQAGAMRAQTMDDLQDLVVTLTTEARRVKGTGVVLVSGGGGYAVLSSDAIANAGLDVPQMPQETIDELREFIPVAGTSVNNPIDTNVSGVELQRKTLEIVARAEPADVVFTNAGSTRPDAKEFDPNHDSPPADQIAHARTSAEHSATVIAEIQRETGTPFVAIERGRSYSVAAGASVDAFAHTAQQNGVAVYATVPRAARALGLLLEWRTRREGLQELF